MRRGLIVCAALVAVVSGCGGGQKGPTEIAFVTTRDGDYAIYGMTAEGKGEHRLVDDEGDPETAQGLFFQIDPAWSRNGMRLAFASKREGRFKIFVMNADGTGTRRVTSTRDQDDVKPSFSPDDTRIAFARGAPADIYIVALATGELQRVTATKDIDEAEPSWSPDGEWIVYARRERDRERVRQLWLIRPDGTADHPLTPFEGISGGPTWSPDSKRVLFSSNVNDRNYEVYAIGVNGKNLQRLTARAEDDFEPTWSRDGRRFAFSREGTIYVSDLSGNEQPIGSGDNDTSPAWRPIVPPVTDE